MGSVTARLAAKTFITDGLKIIYTVHGFHFYKGSPNKYWSIFFPVEKYLSKYTNAIVTINKEDFELISNSKFKNSFSFLIPGVGINTSKFDNIIFSDKDIIRKKNGYQSDTFLILYIAEFIPRKNHEFLLEVVSDLQEKISNFKVLLAGRGVFLEKTKASAKNIGVQDYIDFLGFREDIGEVITMSDIGVSVSKQEGLPMNIAEVMYAGKPVVASKIRGHADLINHKENGFLYDVGDKESFINYIEYLYKNPEARLQIGKEAKLKSKQFELEQCLQEMKKIYSQFLDV
jgi:glycosyltransferase EpsD